MASNSESLPDLKWNAHPSSPHVRRVMVRCRRAVLSHSFSDPSLACGMHPTNGRCTKEPSRASAKCPTDDSAVVDLIHRISQQPIETTSSVSDCSDQSGWVSSALSSQSASPLRHAAALVADEDTYPELTPLAPPEEFQVIP